MKPAFGEEFERPYTHTQVQKEMDSMLSAVSILLFFSSVSHVWVPVAKTTGPIAKKFVFS
jgi:hypothetical protein